jgi:alginate O-acetyltransferase complex protein AlgI
VHQLPAPRPIAGVALTYLCVLVACVFFRAPSLSSAGSILAGMAGQHGFGLAPFDLRAAGSICWLAALYAIVWGAPTTRHIMQSEATSRLAWRPSGRWAVVMGCGATIGLLAAGGTGEFLYFRF